MDWSIVLTFAIVLGILFLIVQACSWFTNGIEWTGKRFNLSEGAVGSVLAAVGTALPETLVPIVALLAAFMSPATVSHEASQAIGIGAILGAPFLLSTLAMFVTGVAVLYFHRKGRRSLSIKINEHLFKRDLIYFFAAYAIVVLACWIPDMTIKRLIAVGLIAFYGSYVYRTIRKEHVSDSDFDIEPLILSPKASEPATGLILFQVFLSLLGIIVLAHFFVEQISHLSVYFGIDPLVVSLIICPIATELPEKFNSVVWLGERKDVMAYGNITGAMVFQSMIPPSVGLAFTPWVLNAHGFLSIILCFISSAIIFIGVSLTREHPKARVALFLMGGLFYLIFLISTLYSVGF
ncbi:MAG: hypothetical protein VKJ04_05425 [Vampirovibrionales bacterium]|nr:hypothetical protein [Vampirovibrionales bacterium]